MEKIVKKFKSFKEAEKADKDYYHSLSPKERLDILLDIINQYREEQGEAGKRFERVYRVVKLKPS